MKEIAIDNINDLKDGSFIYIASKFKKTNDEMSKYLIDKKSDSVKDIKTNDTIQIHVLRIIKSERNFNFYSDEDDVVNIVVEEEIEPTEQDILLTELL